VDPKSTPSEARAALNILHVSPTFYPATAWGGPIFSTYGLCNALAKSPGVSLKVLTTDAAGRSRRKRLDRGALPMFEGYDVLFCRRLAGHSLSPELVARLGALIRWADCVHLTGVFSFPTIPTLCWCRVLGKPVVWSLRGSFKRWEGNRKPLLKRGWTAVCGALLDPDSTLLHVTSEIERQESSEKVSRVEFRVIRNGIEIPNEVRRQQPFLADGVVRVLFIGRLHEIKGIERLLEALYILRQSCDARLTIAGEGESAYVFSLRQLVRERGLEKNVQFAGFVEGADKQRLFVSADVCVVPSHTENFGMVVAEALAHGVPVIASTGTPWERLPQVGCGLWVDNTPEALAQAVRRVCAMPLEEMGIRGRAWMLSEFGWERIAAEMLTAYKELVDARHSQLRVAK
jgi:glycosyltransferase involved in cell wall biosynthesis